MFRPGAKKKSGRRFELLQHPCRRSCKTSHRQQQQQALGTVHERLKLIAENKPAEGQKHFLTECVSARARACVCDKKGCSPRTCLSLLLPAADAPRLVQQRGPILRLRAEQPADAFMYCRKTRSRYSPSNVNVP